MILAQNQCLDISVLEVSGGVSGQIDQARTPKCNIDRI